MNHILTCTHQHSSSSSVPSSESMLHLVYCLHILLSTCDSTMLPDLREGLNSIVSGPLENVGYVPVAEAIATCERIARWKVEEEIARCDVLSVL